MSKSCTCIVVQCAPVVTTPRLLDALLPTLSDPPKLVASLYIHPLKLGSKPLRATGCPVIDNPNARYQEVTVDSGAANALYSSLTSREMKWCGLVKVGLSTPAHQGQPPINQLDDAEITLENSGGFPRWRTGCPNCFLGPLVFRHLPSWLVPHEFRWRGC